MEKRKTPETELDIDEPDRLYTPEEAATILNISRRTLMDLRRKGEIRGVTITPKRIGFLQSDVDDYILRKRI